MKKKINLHKIGEQLEFNDSRERTNGQRSEGIVTLAPGRKGPGAHEHTLQTEGFEVISGKLIAIVNGKEIVASPGETVIIRPGEPHTFANGSETEPMVARFWFEPALNAEYMLQTLGEDAMARGGDWAKVSLLPAMYLMFKLRKEYRLAGMPYWLQDVIFGLGAGIAVLSGASKKIQLPETELSSVARTNLVAPRRDAQTIS